MDFSSALNEAVSKNKISVLDENFDKSLLVCLQHLLADKKGAIQLCQYENILDCEPNFGGELILAYLESKKEKDISFSKLAYKVEELSNSLDAQGISCYIYSYFISAYFSLISSFFGDMDFKNLGVKEVKWLNPEECDYELTDSPSEEKTFGYGRPKDTKKDFIVLGTTLKRYRGKSAYVIVPHGVKTIGGWAFRGNKKVKSVYIPSTVTTIKSFAFYGCKELKSVHLSENLKALLPYTFEACRSLKKINLENVSSIGACCFKDCDLLKIEKEGQ